VKRFYKSLQAKRSGGRRSLMACALGTVLVGCSANPHIDRAQFAAPTEISEIHTQAQLALALAVKLDAKLPCETNHCGEPLAFEERVNLIGNRLAEAAYQNYPGLSDRVPEFQFSVFDKSEPGTVSTPGGRVGVLRPVSGIAQSDEALSYVLAREIGHIIGRHHEENTATSTAISIIATLLAPVVKVVKVLATVYQGVTPAAASASVTAASFASSRLVISSYKPVQREEADSIALNLLQKAEVDERSAYEGFSRQAMETQASSWTRELQESLDRLSERVAQRERENPSATVGRLKLATKLEGTPRSAALF
jgi:predicted Zn-dependent protease